MTGRRQSWIRSGSRALVAGLVLGSLSLTACNEVETASPEAYQPASLSPPDESGLKDVTLTEVAVERIELKTDVVEAEGRYLEIPVAALIYDGKGQTWDYTVISADQRRYRRAKVVYVRQDDNDVLLSKGPKPGTLVVTQGATQVYGAELGMEGKH